MKISIEETSETTFSVEVEGEGRKLVKMVTQAMFESEEFEWVIREAVKQFTLAKIFGEISKKEIEKVKEVEE